MYNVQELATAALHRIGLVAVVFADGAFGNVWRMQKELYGGRRIAVDLQNPDFVKLAESFGISARRANDPEELRQSLRSAIATAGPTLIEVPVGEMTRPWDYIHMPRVRPPKTS
jgi:acetolactate synthase-1/2/3 large subunit